MSAVDEALVRIWYIHTWVAIYYTDTTEKSVFCRNTVHLELVSE